MKKSKILYSVVLLVFVVTQMLGLAVPPTRAYAAAPALAAPTDLQVPTQAYDDTSITLVWHKPANYSNIADYNVYMNGKFLAKASDNTASPAKKYMDQFYNTKTNLLGDPVITPVQISMHSFIVTGLKPDTTYTFTVKSVDKDGNESAASNVVTQKTTAEPKVYNVMAFGAKGDGTTLDTDAIQKAINACTPGGEVLLPAGKTFLSGALWLKGDMIFRVDGTLSGSTNPADYPYPDPTFKTVAKTYSLINALSNEPGAMKNIKIVGTGVIDGNGWKTAGADALTNQINSGMGEEDQFPSYAAGKNTTVYNAADPSKSLGLLAANQVKFALDKGFSVSNAYSTRSCLITLNNVDNVYFGDGLTFRNPAYHTLVTNNCNNVVLNRGILETFNTNNGDGIEFSASGLTVINNVFDTGDDNVNFSAGKGAASESLNPTQNAWIFDNYMAHGHGSVVGGSNTAAWIQNILAEDNVINGTLGLRLKTAPGTGGGARNITYRDTAIRNTIDGDNYGFEFRADYYDPNAVVTFQPALDLPQFENIQISNVSVDYTKKYAIYLSGLSGAPHNNIHFTNVQFNDTPAAHLNYMTDSSFTNVTFTNVQKGVDPWDITDSTGLTFDGGTTSTPSSQNASAAPTWTNATLTRDNITDNGVTLTWSGASDNTGVAMYKILSGNTPLATVDGSKTSIDLTGLSSDTDYSFKVEAADATGNWSTTGPSINVSTTGTKDTTAPTVTDSLVCDPATLGTTWANLEWTPATDNSAVDHYNVYVNGELADSVNGNVNAVAAGALDQSVVPISAIANYSPKAGKIIYAVGNLVPNTKYTFKVEAVDAAGNVTPYPTDATANTLPQSASSLPVWPVGSAVAASNITGNSVQLSWNVPTSSNGIAGYRVYENGVAISDPADIFTSINTLSTTINTTYNVTGLVPNTTYTFKVEACDNDGSWTGLGPSVTVTTSTPGQTAKAARVDNGNPASVLATVNAAVKGNTEVPVIDVTNSPVASKNIFNAIKGLNKVVTFEGNNVSWTFNGKDITSAASGDIDLSLKAVSQDLSSKEAAKVKAVVGKDVSIVPFSFSYDGPLPGTAAVKVYISKDWANKTVNVYRYFADTNIYEEVQSDVKVDADGYVTYNTNHCSDYFVAETSAVSTISNTTTSGTLPQTGSLVDAGMVADFGAVFAVLGIAMLVFDRKRKGNVNA